MEIDYIKEFVVLSQTANFLEAADILYSSQSTLSKHLKRLEKELGVPLFDRTTRKVVISKYGQIFLPFANKIIELQDQHAAALKDHLETEMNVLNLGCIPALAEYKITDILVNFKKIHPQLTINVEQEGNSGLKEMLRQKKCELAFIRFCEEGDDDLEKTIYDTDNMVAVFALNHPLAQKKKIPLHTLANENLVLSEKNTMLYRICVSACKQNGFEPRIAYTDHKYENIVDFVIKGMGVALMMKKLALHVSNPQVSIVDVTPSVITRINLCYLKDRQLSKIARDFLQFAKSHRSNS
jgi:LysR family transcriptional activator of glutamate synthase operon